MLDEKKLHEIEKRVPFLINSDEITKDEKNKQMVKFYLDNALLSLNTAKILREASSNRDIKNMFKFVDANFESYLWVINSSYYSMFYMAGALLASIGVKVKSEIGVHAKTYNALVYYFYLNKRIAKHYLEEFEEAQSQCQEILGTEEPFAVMQKKAKELMLNYDYVMDKRRRFTYNMGEKDKAAKAETSLKRAIEFYNECLRLLQ